MSRSALVPRVRLPVSRLYGLFILRKDDQFLPAAFLRRLAQQRLGTVPDEVPRCHCAALSHPKELGDLELPPLSR